MVQTGTKVGRIQMMFYQGNKVRVNCSADEGMQKYRWLEDFVCDTHLDCGLRIARCMSQ